MTLRRSLACGKFSWSQDWHLLGEGKKAGVGQGTLGCSAVTVRCWPPPRGEWEQDWPSESPAGPRRSGTYMYLRICQPLESNWTSWGDFLKNPNSIWPLPRFGTKLALVYSSLKITGSLSWLGASGKLQRFFDCRRELASSPARSV